MPTTNESTEETTNLYFDSNNVCKQEETDLGYEDVVTWEVTSRGKGVDVTWPVLACITSTKVTLELGLLRSLISMHVQSTKVSNLMYPRVPVAEWTRDETHTVIITHRSWCDCNNCCDIHGFRGVFQMGFYTLKRPPNHTNPSLHQHCKHDWNIMNGKTSPVATIVTSSVCTITWCVTISSNKQQYHDTPGWRNI